MARKDRMDAVGSAALVGVALLFALNQVVIKFTNEGLQPVFLAGARSALAIPFVAGWMAWRRMPLRIAPGTVGAGLLIGAAFSVEFLGLFVALDLTAVSRVAIIFYTMPVWLALMAHFGLPGERLTPVRGIGLALAFAGTVTALTDRPAGGHASLAGDLCALAGALGWAATAYLTRGSALRRVSPEMQLLWMIAVSAPILLLASPAFGPLFRDLQPVHLVLLVAQAGVVVAGGFIVWLWLLSTYPASTVASFSFLTPVFGLALGALILGEPLTMRVILAASLVAGGIVLVNRRG